MPLTHPSEDRVKFCIMNRRSRGESDTLHATNTAALVDSMPGTAMRDSIPGMVRRGHSKLARVVCREHSIPDCLFHFPQRLFNLPP